MAEETLSTSTIDQAEGTKVEKEINPYFAIEEKYFGIKDKKEIRRKRSSGGIPSRGVRRKCLSEQPAFL